MHTRTLFGLCGSVALLAAATAGLPPADGDEIEWRTSLAKAEAEARESKKPMLVVFRCEP